MTVKLRRVVAVRYEESDHGTFSKWVYDGKIFDAIELPDRNNVSNLSRIPAGTYVVKMTNSPKFGKVYHITDVKGRSHVLQHGGNYAGDSTMNLRTDSHGCILMGLARGIANGQKAILNSRTALRRFIEMMGGTDFELEIREKFA